MVYINYFVALPLLSLGFKEKRKKWKLLPESKLLSIAATITIFNFDIQNIETIPNCKPIGILEPLSSDRCLKIKNTWSIE